MPTVSKLKFPPNMFRLNDGEKPTYGEAPHVKRATDFFKSLMSEDEWSARRSAIAMRFYQSLIGEDVDHSGKGKYFDDKDLFGWQLFQAEAFTDHPWNYEVVYGCRVVPIFAAIGAALDDLLKTDGFLLRATDLVSKRRAQPNGPLFEMLVAAAYAREGAKVAFRPETPGEAKSYDLDVELDRKRWAIECKRMEGGEYHEQERERMRELWKEPCFVLMQDAQNAILEVNFKVELRDVPEDYLLQKVQKYVGRSLAYHSWTDRVASGSIERLNLLPIQEELKTNGYLLHPSPKFSQLLTGRYHRADNMLSMMVVQPASNPHFVTDLSRAAVCRWSSLSEDAIEKKARDILKRLSEANEQLPTDVSGAVHIGFEALGEDNIEQRRFEKIVQTARQFDRGGSKLEVIYCHYFAPDPAPDEVWAIDETIQWIGVSRVGRPLEHGVLLPSTAPGRAGVHWKSATAPAKIGRVVASYRDTPKAN
jgi:hypothetical protein